MSTRQTLTLGNDRFRVGPWQGDTSTAYLALTSDVPRPSLGGLQWCLRRLRDEGYSSIVTAALHPDEAESFLRTGFVEYDRLHVLSHSLADLDPPRPHSPSSVRLLRAARRDRVAALDVDHLAFPGFWRLDEAGLDDALEATPHRRFRIAVDSGRVVGYAVTGRAGRQAFLQRLATHPAHSGAGIGSSLVLDALHWARRRRAGRMLVNTQTGNHRALALYRRLGFARTPTDLVVLTRPIT
jgi:ribosomal protein S18 acetylase RimI-like enzyme